MKKNQTKNDFDKILRSFDFILLVISSAYINLISCSIDLVANLTAVDTFKWSLTRLGVVTGICIVVYSMLMFSIENGVMKMYITGT